MELKAARKAGAVPARGAIESQRLELVHTLAATAVHEFSNLLMPVLVRADAARSSGDPAQMAAALDAVSSSVTRAVDVARRIMTLARSRTPGCEACHAGDAVREALQTWARSFDKDDIRLELHVDESLAVVADPLLFEQFILNLILDARAAVHRHIGRIQLVVAAGEKGVRVTVRDNRLAAPAHAQPSDDAARRVDASADIARLHGAEMQIQTDGGQHVVTAEWPAAHVSAASA